MTAEDLAWREAASDALGRRYGSPSRLPAGDVAEVARGALLDAWLDWPGGSSRRGWAMRVARRRVIDAVRAAPVRAALDDDGPAGHVARSVAGASAETRALGLAEDLLALVRPPASWRVTLGTPYQAGRHTAARATVATSDADGSPLAVARAGTALPLGAVRRLLDGHLGPGALPVRQVALGSGIDPDAAWRLLAGLGLGRSRAHQNALEAQRQRREPLDLRACPELEVRRVAARIAADGGTDIQRETGRALGLSKSGVAYHLNKPAATFPVRLVRYFAGVIPDADAALARARGATAPARRGFEVCPDALAALSGPNAARDRRLVRAVADGATLADAGARYGVSEVRALQIVAPFRPAGG